MIRRLSISLFFILIISSLGFSQKTAELGILVGRSYYLGELNPKTHWGNGVGSLTFGGIFRYNLNERYSVKGSIIRTTLTAKDEWNTITEFAGEIEFNFLPYKMGDKRYFFSPYLFVGVSYFINDISTTVEGFDPAPTNQDGGGKLAIPFGPGVKLSLGKKWAFSMEWGFRKTGYDLIDGLENRVNDVFESGKTYDNDWFVVSGFMLTYKITDEGPCPVYNF